MPDDPYAPSHSFVRRFDDPDAFATTIPGGSFGVLPVVGETFKATVRITNLGDGVAIRGVAVSSPVVFRSEFIGAETSITYMLPSIGGATAVFDGHEVDGRSLVSRTAGQTPQLRTFGAHELGGLVLLHEPLLEAAEAITGRQHSKLLLTPASLARANPAALARLQQTYLKASRLLDGHSAEDIADAGQQSFRVLRDEVLAALLSTLVSGEVKRDHLARQRQTASMARIERFLDDHRDDHGGLQQLCEATGMALRTVEAIIRSRTGLSALAYLQRRRLDAVRQALLHAGEGTTVTRVAMQHGFFHLGRFSVFYRQIYGESPSTTLRRTLGSASG